MLRIFKNNNKEVNQDSCKEKLERELNRLNIEKDTIIQDKDLQIEKLTQELENERLEHELLKKQKIEVLSKLSNDMEKINNSISSQASVSEELTATIEEINATISSISERVNSAYEGAKTNGAVMNKFNNDNEDIYDNTKILHTKMQNVSKIIETINSISKQTNLLSLNASIESARAGEAGRGFSVVASEIRKLAEQTKESSTEIQKIIEELQTRTNDILDKTTESKINSQKLTDSNVARIENIEDINEMMKEMVTGVDQMSSAMQEQSANIIEIANETDSITNLIKLK